MIKCKKCGTENKENSVFCKQCGKSLIHIRTKRKVPDRIAKKHERGKGGLFFYEKEPNKFLSIIRFILILIFFLAGIGSIFLSNITGIIIGILYIFIAILWIPYVNIKAYLNRDMKISRYFKIWLSFWLFILSSCIINYNAKNSFYFLYITFISLVIIITLVWMVFKRSKST